MSTSIQHQSPPPLAMQDAFVAYVTENQENFYRLAYSYVKEQHTALDMIQNAIYNALKSIDTVKEPRYIKTWFYRILINACLDELRKNKRSVITAPEDLPDLPASQTETERQVASLDLYNALERLHPTARTIVTLRYFEDMTLKQIADVLGENISTVKTKLYRALDKLKIQLEEEAYSDDCHG